MQGHHVVVAAAVSLALCQAALGQPAKPKPGKPPAAPFILGGAASTDVVIFEQQDFTGRSATLTSGEHRITDWKPASIRVPAGLIAILFESADAAGGFGISVDLMEDHPDLAAFGLDRNVSFILVTPSVRPNLFWARARTENGQFIAGHWERNRAKGNPVNTVAVASPPLASRAPAAPSLIRHQGTTWTIATLGPQSEADAFQWRLADRTMGVIGSDFRGPQEIGSAAFQRASGNVKIPDWLNFWYPNKQRNDHRPIVYFKRTLTGVITDTITRNWSRPVPDGHGGVELIHGTYELSDVPHVTKIFGTYADFDLNIDVAPFADYLYLIRDSHPPERSTEKKLKDIVDSDHDPCTDPFIKVEAEIDAGNLAKESIAASLRQRVGEQVAVYGPWVYDIAHCCHPEIHPAEQIWWTEKAGKDVQVYHLNVFADSSKRFWWRSQMDDGTKLRPWGAPPIAGLFAIAFEVRVGTTDATVGAGRGKRFEVGNVDQWNVAPVPDSNKVHDLVYRGRALISFVPHNDAFKVSYENVGLKPGTTDVVRGFLVIETTVGIVKQIATRVVLQPLQVGNQAVIFDVPQGADPDEVDQRVERAAFHKEGGHYVFTVTRTDTGGLGHLSVEHDR